MLPATVRPDTIDDIVLAATPTPATPPPPAACPQLLEVAHVAHRLNTCAPYVRRLLRAGTLKGLRFGTRWRVDPRDLKAYIDSCRTAGRPEAGP